MRRAIPMGVALALALTACGDDGGTPPVATGDEADATTEPDVADAEPDVASDPGEDADGGPGAGCEDGAWSCSEDAHVLTLCEDGAWTEVACMTGQGRLCEAGACVDPWRYGDPTWGTCPDDPQATPETLAAKAAAYDELAWRLHVRPDLGWIMSVYLDPAAPPDLSVATWEDVLTWRSGENDGLWNGLYMASQAFRYAVTGDAEVLEHLGVLVAAEQTRMAITGVPGVFTRQYIPAGIDGLACPSDDGHYTTDVEKDDNRWVRIGDTGCAEVVEHATGEWVTTDHCGFEAYVGWCWLDNVSQDEYAGHMMALAAIAKLVDDPTVRDPVVTMIEQVADHLMANDLQFIDWDGRVTEHGKLYATSFANAPGFLSSQVLGYFRMAIEVTGRQDLRDYYEGCLLQKEGVAAGKCMDHPLEVGDPYHTEYLPIMGLYLGNEGCKSNFNNFSMVMTYLFDLLWYETDPEVRSVAQTVLDEVVVRPDEPRAIEHQENTWFHFMWAAMKALGPGSDGPAYAAVEEGICGLRQFDATKAAPTKDPSATYPHYCEGRLGDSQTEHPVPVAERCPRTFLWWSSPYDRDPCTENPADVRHPADYLLAYWMGRYFGFISPEL